MGSTCGDPGGQRVGDSVVVLDIGWQDAGADTQDNPMVLQVK